MVHVRKNSRLRGSMVVAVLSFVTVSVTAFAAATAASPSTKEIFGDRRMSVQAKKTGVRELLEFVLRAQNIKYDLSSSVDNHRLVSVTVKEAQVSEIFDFLIKEGILSYIVSQDGVLQIGPAKKPQ